jgi:PAS domain S-box-containing protein
VVGESSRRRLGTWEPNAAVLLLAICLLLQAPAGAQVKLVRRVLILNELGPVASPAINLVDGAIRDRLARSPYNVELYAESLETTLFPDPAAQQEFLESYIHKYHDRQPDVIIAVGPSPLHFLAQSHDKFFPDTPVVFCVSTPGMVGNPTLDSSFTGVWEMPDFAKTLDVALKLLPDTRHIVVVGGVAVYDRANEAIIRDGLRSYDARFDVTYLTDLDMSTLLERLGRLPKHSIILQAGISEDAAGTRYIVATQSDPLVARVANAPVFPSGAMADVDVGQGAIGGYLVSFAKEGEIAAADAARILDGEKPKDIPIVRGASAYMFDWRALKRWGLREADLPPGSLVLYRQPNFWELYRRYVLLGLLICGAQLVAIVALVWQRAQRMEAQRRSIRFFSQLHESEERFRLAMVNVASGVYTLDLNGLVTYVNPAAEAMFGWTNAELLGRKMHDVTHYKHPDGSPFPASDCPGLQLHKGVELHEQEDMFIRKDGSFFPVVYSASPLKSEGRTVGIVVGFRDDTQRREAERAVRESEERFRLMADTAPVKVWMSGLDKGCTYCNRRWLQFTGRPMEAELGNGWAEGVHPDDFTRCLDTYTHAFDRRLPFQIEYRLRRHDGEYRWVLASGAPQFAHDGSFSGYVGSAIDVTDHRLAREALSNLSRSLMDAQEKERAWIARDLHDDVGQSVAVLALQLNDCAQVLPSGTPEHATVQKACDQVDALAHDLRGIAHRLHSAKLEHLGLALAVAALCRDLSEQHHVKIDFNHSGIPGNLSKDIALCLFRVLQEALNNALRHAGVGQFTVTLRGTPTEIQLEVSDTGIGFDPEVAISGQGLGLISMRERLRLVKGDIFIESRPGRGTTIRARVGLSPVEAPAIAAS